MSGGTDPNAVQKTGDTMTGTLNVRSADGSAVVEVTNSTNPGVVSLSQAPNGRANITLTASSGSSATIQGDSAGNMWLVCPILLIDCSNKAQLFSNGQGVDLFLDANADLHVTALSGPNSGKSVNLTVGKWA